MILNRPPKDRDLESLILWMRWDLLHLAKVLPQLRGRYSYMRRGEQLPAAQVLRSPASDGMPRGIGSTGDPTAAVAGSRVDQEPAAIVMLAFGAVQKAARDLRDAIEFAEQLGEEYRQARMPRCDVNAEGCGKPTIERSSAGRCDSCERQARRTKTKETTT